MADAWRSYLELAYGLGKTSRKKAEKAVRDLVGKSNAKASELQGMVEDLLAAGSANRDAVVELVRTEMDKSLNRVGLAKAEELTALRERVAELEATVAASPAASASVAAAVAAPVATAAAKKTATAKKTVAKKAPAAASSESAPAKKAPAKKAAAKTTAKKAVAKKAPAKKAAQ